MNLLDGITNGLLVMLLVIGIAHQETPSADAMGVLGTAATMMSTLIMCVLGFMFLLAGTALIFRKQLGGSQELKIMNLGNVTPTAAVMSCLEEVATAAAALTEGSKDWQRWAEQLFASLRARACYLLLVQFVHRRMHQPQKTKPADDAAVEKMETCFCMSLKLLT